MALMTVTATAAVAAVGANLLSGEQWRSAPVKRKIRGLFYTGSTAIGDTAVELWVGSNLIGRFYNSKLLVGDADDLMPVLVTVPPNQEIAVKVIDAAATNAVFVGIDIDPS